MVRFGEAPKMSVEVDSIEQKLLPNLEKSLERLRVEAPDSEITKCIGKLKPEEIRKLDITLDGIGIDLGFFATIRASEEQDEIVKKLEEILAWPVGSDEFKSAKNAIENFLP